jgi:hypothetical protein
MIFNNKDKTGDLERRKMTGERARKAKVIKFHRDVELGVWKSLKELIRDSSSSTEH